MVSGSVRAWLPATAKGTAVLLRPPPVGVSVPPHVILSLQREREPDHLKGN